MKTVYTIKTVADLRAQIMKEAEIKSLKKDAARYRFLRAIDYTKPFETKRAVKVAVCDWGKNLDSECACNIWSSMEVAGPDMDKEVDRQMQKAKRGGAK